MPRGYDSYLMGSLCQSDSDGEPVTNVVESTPIRRPSLSDALPRIPIKLEGCGVSVTLKAGPHVRWTKILAKWSACFPNSSQAPMPWPVVATVGEERIPISSIQESVSRSIGPELLMRVADQDPAIIVTIGQSDRQDPVEDVAPPPVPTDEPDLPCTAAPTTDPVEEIVERASHSVKIQIESKLVSKRAKLNVSSGCTVGRLVKKWLEASRSTINADLVELVFQAQVLDRNKALHDVLPPDLPWDQRVSLQAELNVENSPKRKKSKRDSLPTPPTTAQRPSIASPHLASSSKRVMPNDSSSPRGGSSPPRLEGSQEAELLYWQQVKAAEAQGLHQFVHEEESEEWVDDEEALAIALSLSELPPSAPSQPSAN